MKKFFVVLLSLFLMAGCSKAAGRKEASYLYDPLEETKLTERDYAGSNAYQLDGNSNYNYEVQLDSSRKMLVYTGSLVFETEHYDEFLKELNEKLAQYDGITSYSKETTYSSRDLTLTVMIPCEHFDSFINESNYANGVRTGVEANMDDITEAYDRNVLKIESLEAQHTRIIELLDKASSLSDVVTLEQRLSEIEEELEWYNNEKNNMDAKVRYSTVYIHVSEVKTYTETNFLTRIGGAFSGSWHKFLNDCEDFVVWLIYAIPAIVILAVAILVFRKPVAKGFRKIKDRLVKNKKEEETVNSQ